MNWKLNESNFTWKDRLKICKFFLTKKNMWTMGDQVEKYEEAMREFVGCKHAVFVSSGSTANTLLAMYLKDRVYTPEKKLVVFPSTTWITSVSPFMREGFTPKFIDISMTDLSMDLVALEKYIKRNKNKIAAVFVTSLLGFVPNISKLIQLASTYNVKIMLDNCENTLGSCGNKNVSAFFTSTTSTYFGHQLQSVEGGFIFTNNQQEYEYFLMARNHGMVRGLKENKPVYANLGVDARFDFNLLGNNFRNTNINAFIGLLDLKRVAFYTKERKRLYSLFYNKIINGFRCVTIFMRTAPQQDVPFCIPLVFNTVELCKKAKDYCDKNNIECRPIVSGNLLRQTCLRGLSRPSNFPVSEKIHYRGLYVGLHSKVKEKDITALADYINYLK